MTRIAEIEPNRVEAIPADELRLHAEAEVEHLLLSAVCLCRVHEIDLPKILARTEVSAD